MTYQATLNNTIIFSVISGDKKIKICSPVKDLKESINRTSKMYLLAYETFSKMGQFHPIESKCHGLRILCCHHRYQQEKEIAKRDFREPNV